MPLGTGEGWAASRHTTGSAARVVSLVASGPAEVRAFVVAGAAPGTPVRVTGRAPGEGTRAELVPLHSLSGSEQVVGVTGPTDDGTLFVALARLTGEPEPAPLTDLVTVEVADGDEIAVRWASGADRRFRFARAEDGTWPVGPLQADAGGTLRPGPGRAAPAVAA